MPPTIPSFEYRSQHNYCAPTGMKCPHNMISNWCHKLICISVRAKMKNRGEICPLFGYLQGHLVWKRRVFVSYMLTSPAMDIAWDVMEYRWRRGSLPCQEINLFLHAKSYLCQRKWGLLFWTFCCVVDKPPHNPIFFFIRRNHKKFGCLSILVKRIVFLGGIQPCTGGTQANLTCTCTKTNG